MNPLSIVISESLLPNFNLRINLQDAQNIISGLDTLLDECSDEDIVADLEGTKNLILNQLIGQGVDFTE
jgi:flagellin-specific chaperone FliS